MKYKILRQPIISLNFQGKKTTAILYYATVKDHPCGQLGLVKNFVSKQFVVARASLSIYFHTPMSRPSELKLCLSAQSFFGSNQCLNTFFSWKSFTILTSSDWNRIIFRHWEYAKGISVTDRRTCLSCYVMKLSGLRIREEIL